MRFLTRVGLLRSNNNIAESSTILENEHGISLASLHLILAYGR